MRKTRQNQVRESNFPFVLCVTPLSIYLVQLLAIKETGGVPLQLE